MNKYKKIDLGGNNSLRQFDSVDLSNYKNTSQNRNLFKNNRENISALGNRKPFQ